MFQDECFVWCPTRWTETQDCSITLQSRHRQSGKDHLFYLPDTARILVPLISASFGKLQTKWAQYSWLIWLTLLDWLQAVFLRETRIQCAGLIS
ncbi:hypothetical protein SD20_01595 [Treponema pallidum subsp. pallidum]|nr:hypothetical protein SD20_01595 [Treponema pallidum subsp. pallidum]